MCMRVSTFVLLIVLVAQRPPVVVAATGAKPNFVIFLMDDVGYGDLGCFGGNRAPTPNFDRLAARGMRLTDFYAHPVCGVTRAALMTGCYAMRVGEVGNTKHPHPVLHTEEVTLAEVLRAAGYRTGMIGKWHLAGQRRERYPRPLMPLGQGFEEYFGTPLHNGTTRQIAEFHTQLVRGNEVVDQFVEQPEMDQLTTQYTEAAVKFINEHRDEPFVLYLAHSMAHVVLGVSDKFRGKTNGGLYGDVLAELDWSAGQIAGALQEAGLADRTMLFITSDNGPWVEQQLHGQGGTDTHYGSPGELRGFKMTTWEGGIRVPTIACWPGQIPAGATCSEPAAIIDLLPTLADLAEAPLPPDRTLDGRSIDPLLRGEEGAKSPHEAIFFYAYTHLQGVRSGRWKLLAPRPAKPAWTSWSACMMDAVADYELYDLVNDPNEQVNAASKHPDVVARLKQHLDHARSDLGDYDRIGEGQRFFDDGPRRSESKRWLNAAK